VQLTRRSNGGRARKRPDSRSGVLLPALVVLAAGLGSRFGGDKQTTPLGPGGAALMEYSIFDALRSGFGSAVIVVRAGMLDSVQQMFDARPRGCAPVTCVVQPVEPGRRKPWGTAHAVLAAAAAVDGPFAVANADDLYGRASFETLAAFLQRARRSPPPEFAIAGFPMGDTLSDAGPVNRAVCETDADGRLTSIVERTGLTRERVAAEATGIPAGTPVISGATDGCAAQLGAGALTVGSWNSVLGTTLILKGVTLDLIRDPLGVVYSHKAPNGDWLPGGASSTGAGVISRDFTGRDLDELNQAASTHEPSGVITYPLVSNGERFPFVAPGARGFVLGEPVNDGDRFAGVLQGVGFIERLSFDYLHLLGAPIDGSLTLTGGATKSAYWCQLRADILGRPVTLPDNAEPALGMAVLAASPGRVAADVAAEMVRVRDIIDPRPGTAGMYDSTYRTLVTELEHRGWLPPEAAAHARTRTSR